MFRLLGVPARYVTGYVVTPEEFTEDGDGYTAQVPDTQAHAWVEVYRSGKGWIPVEVTPGYQENISGNENQEVPGEESTPTPEPTAEQTEETTPELTETPQPEQGEAAVTPQGENGSESAGTETNTDNSSGGSGLVGIGRALLKIFVLLLILVGLAGGSAGVVALHRKRILQERNRRFFQKNINRGICEISYAIYQILQDAKEAGVLISFDPNLRKPLWKSMDDAKEKISWGLSQCDILKISDDEIEFMTGEKDIKTGVKKLIDEYHIPFICATMGKNGSMAFFDGHIVEAAPFLRDDTVETTGAGDTFCACLLHDVLEHGINDRKDDDVKKMLTFANAAASLITTRKGALRVMPEKGEVEAVIK